MRELNDNELRQIDGGFEVDTDSLTLCGVAVGLIGISIAAASAPITGGASIAVAAAAAADVASGAAVAEAADGD